MNTLASYGVTAIIYPLLDTRRFTMPYEGLNLREALDWITRNERLFVSQIIETRPIHKQKDKYIGWPTIAKSPDGTLHAVFSGDRDLSIPPQPKFRLVSLFRCITNVITVRKKPAWR